MKLYTILPFANLMRGNPYLILMMLGIIWTHLNFEGIKIKIWDSVQLRLIPVRIPWVFSASMTL